MRQHLFDISKPFQLENGASLPLLQLTYHCDGALNQERNNVIWLFHALTGNSNPFDWWRQLLQQSAWFDPSQFFIICVNMPGSCYGSTGPLSINPNTQSPYYHDFPILTNRDVVKAFQLLKQHLGIQKIQLGIGGSLGGQQLIEWAIIEPNLFETIIPLATNAKHSPWGIAFNASQRWAIDNDSTWSLSERHAGIEGLKLARSIALLSYRTASMYNSSQMDVYDHLSDAQTFNHKAIAYQYYQGDKLASRFNAFSYYRLTQMMDLHDVGRGRTGVSNALKLIKAKTIVVSISSDLLFPVADQIIIANHVPFAEHIIIDSNYGHDGFLVETDAIGELLAQLYPVTV